MYKNWENNFRFSKFKQPPLTFAFKGSAFKFTRRTTAVSIYRTAADFCYFFSFSSPTFFFTFPQCNFNHAPPDHTVSKLLLFCPLHPHPFHLLCLSPVTQIFSYLRAIIFSKVQGEGIRVWQRPEFHVWLSVGKKRLPLGGLPPSLLQQLNLVWLPLKSSEDFLIAPEVFRWLNVFTNTICAV